MQQIGSFNETVEEYSYIRALILVVNIEFENVALKN